MQKENSSNKRCCTCFGYNCFFTKKYMRFTREKLGYCNTNNNIVKNKDTCEHWRSNSFLKNRLQKVSINALNDLIAELVEVTSIIRDDIENKNLSVIARERLTKRLNAIEAEIEKEGE